MGKGTLLLVVTLGLLRDPCGTDTSVEGVNGACTRTSDCEKGLSCIGGVCSQADAAAPGDGGEAGPDSGAGDGNPAD